jgi:dTDP-4-dehydrorhamnose reductase
LREEGHRVVDERVELTDPLAIERALGDTRPAAVIHCAAMAAIADCARDPARARVVNVDATATLAHLCASHGVRLVHVSSDLVFDGEGAPYAESASPSPLSMYGRTKAEAESAALGVAGGNTVVARVSLLFGPTRTARRGFSDVMAEALRATDGPPLRLFCDEWRTPLSLRRAARALSLLARSDVAGVLHVGGPERMSRLEMGARLARVLGVEDARARVESSSRTSAPGEPRPRDVSLDSRAFRERFASALHEDGADDFESECRAMLAHARIA